MNPELSLSKTVSNIQQQEDLSSLIGEFVAKIRCTENEADTFATGVDLVRHGLKCDRVVIYTLATGLPGKIVAEVVTPGFPQILGTVVDDSYFQSEYIQKYQKGRVKTINDIYTEPVNPLYLKNLEKFDVKANVVVPIVNRNGTLYGLLIAHQCSKPRHWRSSEINLMLQVADWIISQLENQQKYQRLENKLNQINQWQDSLMEITKKLYTANNVAEVLQIITDKVQKVLNCDRVVVYSLQKPTFGQIIAESVISTLAPILGRTIDDPCFEYHYLAKYQQGRVKAIDNIYEAGMTPCYIENLASIGVKSNLVAPINWDNGKIYGLLVAHQCFTFREWQETEIWWLKQVALQTGFSLSKAQAKEETKLINSNLMILENARDIVTISKSQVQEMEQPIKKTSQKLLEILNLNRLLAREIQTINESGSLQSKKETNLIRIIAKKLYINIMEIQKNFDLFCSKNKEIQKILEEAATELYSNSQNSK